MEHLVTGNQVNKVDPKPYTVFDQISAQRRMVIAAGNVGVVNPVKNSWTGR